MATQALWQSQERFMYYLMRNNTILSTKVQQNTVDISANTLADTVSHDVVGDYKWSARAFDFGPWLLCDGRLLDKSEFSALYAIIGASFGEDASGNQFRLPNCAGRVLTSAGSGAGLTTRSIGDTYGSETHSLTTSEMPSHTHTGTTASSGSHNHGGSTSTNGNHTHTHNANGGAGTPSNPSVGLVYSNGENTNPGNVDYTANEPNLYTGPIALTINEAGSHSHTISSDGAHTHTFTTDSTGSNAAFSISQPSIVVGNLFIHAGK